MSLLHAVPSDLLAPVTALYGLDRCDLYRQEKLRGWGRFFGYPECCIEAFVVDRAQGAMPAMMRGVTPGGWVPCGDCFRAARWL